LFTQVSVAAISGYLAQRWFGGYAPSIAAVCLTMVLFVYCEAIPKTLAVRRPLPVGLALSRLIRMVITITGPATRALLRVSDLQIPGHGSSVRTAYTEEELRMLMIEAAEAGEIDSADAELAARSFDFGDKSVRDILVPRAGIVAISSDATLDAAITVAVAAGHRRLPVYDGALDRITGVVRLRDLAAAVSSSPDTSVATVAQPVLRVGPELSVASLLSEFQRTGTTFAVIERADTTLGIATIEDVVAELVGEIEDLT
jgi:CBS domain containing-hemolysin-like protein